MRLFPKITVTTAVFVYLATAAAQSAQSTNAGSKVLRGWLSDEHCARARASSGIYTATSPRCAKECVAKGRKIVLIDPDKKMIIAVANQGAAKQNVGDYVEVSGTFSENASTLHINSLQLLDKGVAACERPKLER